MKRTYVIAEVANSHEGSVALAKCFIKAAAKCGADAVKFQTHIFEAESLADAFNPQYFQSETRKEYFERTAFSYEQWRALKEYAENECKVDFISSPFSQAAVELLEQVGVNSYKVPSGEVTNIPLLKMIARTGKKVLLSSGMSSWQELDEAVETLKQNGCCDLTVMQCTSEYPCAPERSGLNVLAELSARYQCELGYSDHTLGVAVPLAAIMLGATVLEKHFILSNEMYGSDAKHSLEPEKFRYLVDQIREIDTARFSRVNKDEAAQNLRQMKSIFEKKIVFANAMQAGETITEASMAFKKTAQEGFSPTRYKEILGKRLIVNVTKDHVVNKSDFEGD